MSASEDSEPFIIPTSVPPAFRAHYKRMVIVHALAPVSLTTLELQRICSSLRKWEQTWLVPLSASGSSSSSSSSCSSRESTPLSTPKSSPAPSRTNSTLSVDSNSSAKASMKKRKNTKRKNPNPTLKSTITSTPNPTQIPPIPNLIPKIPKQIPETDYFSAIVQLNSLSSLVEIGLQNVDAEMERVQNEFNEMAREAHAKASAKARARARAGVVVRARNVNSNANANRSGSGSGSGSEDGEGEEDVNAHIAFLLASAMLKLGELEREKKICDDTHAFYVDLTQRIYDLCYA